MSKRANTKQIIDYNNKLLNKTKIIKQCSCTKAARKNWDFEKLLNFPMFVYEMTNGRYHS